MSLRSKLATFSVLRHRAEESVSDLPALMIEAEEIVRSFLAGAHARYKSGNGESFWQFRDYEPTDRPQDIDWRRSARSDRVQIRQKEQLAPRTLCLSVACGPRMAYASRRDIPSKVDSARILALGAALLATKAGERVTLASSSSALRPGRGELTLEKMALELLASSSESSEIILPEHPLPRDSYLMVFSDFLDTPELICRKLEDSGATAGGVLLVQVLDPAETDLPFEGRTLFQSPGDAHAYPVANVSGIRDAYRARIAEHIDALTDLCRHRHWHFLLHRTDTPARETLQRIWNTIGPDLVQYSGERLS